MLPRALADFHGPCRDSGEELNFKFCPVCNNAAWKLYVNPVTGYWYCFARMHGGGGRVEPQDWTEAARQELLGLLTYGTPAQPEWTEVALPEWRPLSDMAQRYLIRRGVEQTTCGLLGLVEMTASPRILVPYHGPLGRIVHWTGRHYIDAIRPYDEPKYKSAMGAKPPFILPRWEAVAEAVLVEGPFDAIAVWQATGMPVISIGGTTLSKRMEHDIRTLVRGNVHIMLDGDAHVKALRLRNQLMDRYSPKLHMIDNGNDPGGLPPEQIREMLR